MVTKHGSVRYDQAGYCDEDVLLFGSELHGLPDAWRKRWSDRTIYVPILGSVRSYNLANTVSLILGHVSLETGIFDCHESAGLAVPPMPLSDHRLPGSG